MHIYKFIFVKYCEFTCNKALTLSYISSFRCFCLPILCILPQKNLYVFHGIFKRPPGCWPFLQTSLHHGLKDMALFIFDVMDTHLIVGPSTCNHIHCCKTNHTKNVQPFYNTSNRNSTLCMDTLSSMGRHVKFSCYCMYFCVPKPT